MNLEGNTISIMWDKDVRHDQWWEKLKATAREHDARIDAARADKPSDDGLHSMAELQKYITEKEQHNQWWEDMKQQARENDIKLAAEALARDIKQQQAQFASLDAVKESMQREAKHQEYLELLAMEDARLYQAEIYNAATDVQKPRKREKHPSMSVWARMFPNAYARRAIRRADRAIAAERKIMAAEKAEQTQQVKSETAPVAMSTKTISESLNLERKTISQMLFNDVPAAETETQSVENAAPIALLPEKALSRFNGDTAQYIMNKWFNETNSMRSAKNRVREIPMVSAKENAPAPVADVAAIEKNMELVARKFTAAQAAQVRADQAAARVEKCADDLALKIKRMESAKSAAAKSKQATTVRCAKAKKALAEIRAKNLRIVADAAMAEAKRARESIGVVDNVVNAANVTPSAPIVQMPVCAPVEEPVELQPVVNDAAPNVVTPESKSDMDAANELAQQWIDEFEKIAAQVAEAKRIKQEQEAAATADEIKGKIRFELLQYVAARDDEIRNMDTADYNMQSTDDGMLVLHGDALMEYRRMQDLRKFIAPKDNLADIDPARRDRFRDISIKRVRRMLNKDSKPFSDRDTEIERERDEFNTNRMLSISAMYERELAR